VGAYLSTESGGASGFLPLQGGGQVGVGLGGLGPWVPAFAGMTMEGWCVGRGASLMHPTVLTEILGTRPRMTMGVRPALRTGL
jgi:hypothetical protein